MLQGSVLRSLLISVCTQYVVISSSFLASNTIYMLMPPKCITAAWTCSLNSRIIDPTAYLAATLEFKPSILNLPKTQLWSPPHSLHQLFFLSVNSPSIHLVAQTKRLEIILNYPLPHNLHSTPQQTQLVLPSKHAPCLTILGQAKITSCQDNCKGLSTGLPASILLSYGLIFHTAARIAF